MNIAYISGVKYGHEFLATIINAGWKVSVVFSYDDSKRHMYSDFASFDDITEKHKIKHIKVKNINDLDNVKFLEQINPDVILVMGWSQLLKSDILKIPKIGVIGSHPTELPKFRGRAPIPWSIIKGLKESALTFFYMDEGIDDGDILDQQKFEINEEDDAESIYEKIINIGKKMLLIDLEMLEKGKAKKTKQDPTKFIEYWPKRTPEDGKIEWTKSGKEIHRLIRATTRPYPGAFCFFKNNLIKIWKACYVDEKSEGHGKIMAINKDYIKVGTGEGVLLLQKISIDSSEMLNPADVFSKEDIGLTLI
jgi:methionyl-tRNA formyltransferase